MAEYRERVESKMWGWNRLNGLEGWEGAGRTCNKEEYRERVKSKIWGLKQVEWARRVGRTREDL